MTSPPRVILRARRARPFFARHPWVYDSSIARVEGDPQAGDEVTLVSREEQFIARGLYNPASTIRVRLYRWEDRPLNEPFWSTRIAAAERLRRQVLALGTPRAGYRLIASESDGLSGLTVDRYDHWLVVRFTSLALYLRRDPLLGLLSGLEGVQGLVARTERGIAQREGLPLDQEIVLGTMPDGPITIEENALVYRVDPRGGQKTGFYLDQRDNRRAVARYCANRRVLDLYCYTGGFSLSALSHGGAASTLGVDSSAVAIDRARENAALNGLAHAQFETGDAHEAMARLRDQGDRFGVVICDPPKFARAAKDLESALKAYVRLIRMAIELLEPDGLLVACSCSGLVDRVMFLDVLASAAEHVGRNLQILEQRGQAPDHPIAASCLETDYLKCIICRVEGRSTEPDS